MPDTATPARPPWRIPRGDRGQAAVEFLGYLPILLLVALVGIQLGLVAYVGSQAGTAARAAARSEAKHDPMISGDTAGLDSVSDWLRQDTTITFPPHNDASEVTASVTIKVPSVVPGIDFFDPVTRSATMPGN
ncbi:MAG: pilus assembly protein [Streptomycetaceae bacterium]|nr:pilus assembly protein [Streptomycetaceae bacterium]